MDIHKVKLWYITMEGLNYNNNVKPLNKIIVRVYKLFNLNTLNSSNLCYVYNIRLITI